ncbi:MAG: peptidase S1 [Brevundimonas sp.]|uniref:peptidase S1 n=1 Tax=Brevundimonas sp. TaxID=1871086 RepID=UPI00391B7856
MKRILGLAAAAVLVSAPAVAQDFSRSPSFGTVNLSAGFTPDPRTVEVVAGGTINASNAASGCVGRIASAPDVRLNWSGGGSLPLVFRTRSSRDTTLVINGPDGRWHCDDDSGGGTNARVIFRNAPSGQYDIWIGTYGEQTAPATLVITEIQ